MKHIKLFESFDNDDDELFFDDMSKEELKNRINDALVEIIDDFDIDINFDDMSIEVRIRRHNYSWFKITDILESIQVLEDYICEFFPDIKVEYKINNLLYKDIYNDPNVLNRETINSVDLIFKKDYSRWVN